MQKQIVPGEKQQYLIYHERRKTISAGSFTNGLQLNHGFGDIEIIEMKYQPGRTPVFLTGVFERRCR